MPTLFPMQLPTSYSDLLARLQSLAFDQCFSLTIKQSRIFGNQAHQAGGERGQEAALDLFTLHCRPYPSLRSN